MTKARAVEGSSPLTRGKLLLECCGRSRTRLIPAHAGKTRSSACLMRSGGAHPRSRGENPEIGADRPRDRGSSPLTRGKPGKLRLIQSRSGLIPAHAGKTARQPPRRAAHPAHPRSRGENLKSATLARNVTGSSPLTRGKLISLTPTVGRRGLIPAHAGKTVSVRITMSPFPAHPRSRGENRTRHGPRPYRPGSSPLTRGKPWLLLARVAAGRLIPAHAGKTLRRPLAARVTAAHPRSRGENSGAILLMYLMHGSSPLTRGKQRPQLRRRLRQRLIPAHAGKTTWTTPCSRPTAAHPRSRGENRKQPRQ